MTLQSKYVVSTRIRCGRSVQGLAFNPNMSEEQYGELETLVSSTLKVDTRAANEPLANFSQSWRAACVWIIALASQFHNYLPWVIRGLLHDLKTSRRIV